MSRQEEPVSLAESWALVQACLRGEEQAWELFIARYRPVLYPMALAMTKDSLLARELSDSLWAELFGTRTDQNGSRVSKLALYSGRGSLHGWLRTLLAQEYVNRYRRNRRFVQLNAEMERVVAGFGNDEPVAPVDKRLDRALEQAIAELSGQERLLLVAFYLDERSLSEIGRMLGLHESTVSRRLKKHVQRLRKRIGHYLRKSGLSLREAEELLQLDNRQISLEIRDQLLQAKDAL